MVNVVATNDELQRQLEEIVARNNRKIRDLNALPSAIRGQIDTQIFDDIEFLLRYITAMHGVMDDVSKTNKFGGQFEF